MNFNQALQRASQLAIAYLGRIKEDIVLVRDLRGRIRLLLQTPPHKVSTEDRPDFKKGLEALAKAISDELSPTYAYSKSDLVLFRDDLSNLFPNDINLSFLGESDGLKVYLHDRLLIGSEWDIGLPDEESSPKRFTLYSMKGGVGRSTTVSILAWHLASKGKRVLVVDLDLESPGVGTTLLDDNSRPLYGIVDWFVEDALGNGQAVLTDMVAESSLANATQGRIAVVPACGADSYDYISKLGRTYLERGSQGPECWPDRLKRLLLDLEAQETPDFVLLDSRTGLHDTSAALMLAVNAETLMFVVDTRQTWAAYEILFSHWKDRPDQIKRLRKRLWVLGSMIPRDDKEDDENSYSTGLRDRSWELFTEYLYDNEPESGEGSDGSNPSELFTFAFDNPYGRHYPRRILWDEALSAFNPNAGDNLDLISASYGSFLRWFDETFVDAVITEDP
jgi:hypothetical protein